MDIYVIFNRMFLNYTFRPLKVIYIYLYNDLNSLGNIS